MKKLSGSCRSWLSFNCLGAEEGEGEVGGGVCGGGWRVEVDLWCMATVCNTLQYSQLGQPSQNTLHQLCQLSTPQVTAKVTCGSDM